MTLWLPHITVAAVIEEQQRFLLVEEKITEVSVYNQPAGHLDEGEDLIHAVTRETLEETGWHFVPEQLVGIYQYTSPGSHTTYIRVCFCGRHTEFDPHRPLDRVIVRTLWWTREQVQQCEHLRSPMVLRCIDDYLAGIRYPLSLLTHLQTQ
ncbi:NUDIX hydrolase [Thioflexithrix psekupsensis]|uniref:Phosphatase NudJ n=1 Tax=Thioflexithrix psekupsensis TaxID=1570016 RepID=A0A251X5K6_9GAMM|nr:NUDIX hydrolase [Thioflexithrix psekupsensis]OUD12676.1 NUDIX hydrolase [Thioflexithrix psekupsensis]